MTYGGSGLRRAAVSAARRPQYRCGVIGPPAFYQRPSPPGSRPGAPESGAPDLDLPEAGAPWSDLPLVGAPAPEGDATGIPGVDVSGGGAGGPGDGDAAWPVLDAARRNPRVARMVDRLAAELDERVHTDREDKPEATLEDLVADRYLLLTRMATRYRVVADGRGRRGSAGAAVMLAAIHRLTHSGRLLVL